MARLLRRRLSEASSPRSASTKDLSDRSDSSRLSQKLRKFGGCFCPAPTAAGMPMEEDGLRVLGSDKTLLNARSSSALLCNVSPVEPALESSSTDCNSKYSMELMSEDCESEELSLDLEKLEPTGENFAAVVAECGRLRGDKKRLQKTLNKLDTQMERVACECETVLSESNVRFKMAINALGKLQATVKALRGDIDKQGRQVTDLTMERDMLQRQLDSAHQELRKMKGNSLVRITEDLATPRRR